MFQGRYKALLIEDGGSLLRVVNYIHLNPVRARLLTVENLKHHPLSSFPKFFTKRRPECLHMGDWLALAGNLNSTGAGMRSYHKYLALTAEKDAQKRSDLHRELCRGWYIGTREGRKALLKDIDNGTLETRTDLTGYGEDLAEMLLEQGLAALGKTSVDLAVGRKLESWKVVLATWIKEHAGVNNRWFSERLHMGTIYNISKGIHQEIKKGNRRKGDWRKLKRAKSKA